jgi:hypothetical protein
MRQDKDLTEAEWFNGDDSEKLFSFLVTRARSRRCRLPHRQFRLFACACCRRVWQLLTDERSRAAVEVSERFADGLAKRSELGRACRAAGAASAALGKGRPEAYLAARLSMWAAADSIQDVAGGTAADAEDLAALLAGTATAAAREAARRSESRRQCDLFRDLFGNPFRPLPAPDAAWLTPTVLGVAVAACEDRVSPPGTLDSDRLRVLADALEEAGCTETAVLSHCRQQAVHVKGCWVIDHLLRDRHP